MPTVTKHYSRTYVMTGIPINLGLFVLGCLYCLLLSYDSCWYVVVTCCYCSNPDRVDDRKPVERTSLWILSSTRRKTVLGIFGLIQQARNLYLQYCVSVVLLISRYQRNSSLEFCRKVNVTEIFDNFIIHLLVTMSHNMSNSQNNWSNPVKFTCHKAYQQLQHIYTRPRGKWKYLRLESCVTGLLANCNLDPLQPSKLLVISIIVI